MTKISTDLTDNQTHVWNSQQIVPDKSGTGIGRTGISRTDITKNVGVKMQDFSTLTPGIVVR